MKQKHADYRMAPFPKFRRFEAVMLRSIQRMPMIHGLLEVDVTKARMFLREHKAKTGETLSFTAFIIACLAKAVDENKAVQAYRKGRNRLILFEDVNVNTQIERELDGQKSAIPYTVRAANRKTFREIHHEIRAAQVQDVAQAVEGMGFKAFPFLPTFLFRIGWWVLWRIGRTSPRVWTKYMGTVGITAVGMFGKGAGWGIPLTGHTLYITLGGITEKPGVVDGQIAMREYLSMTISFDHSIVDGAPAARFTGRLKDLIESGYGLEDSAIQLEQAVASGTSKKN
ncbi:MAG TPA: 2-oxo acid dehydrogenase subunit E2 [Candidatus Bathyarchaeia archaeon]|nr:2-oxo acid dehydrogenase subunit E2 [Candidatus Bathyarchaeia archaeon]